MMTFRRETVSIVVVVVVIVVVVVVVVVVLVLVENYASWYSMLKDNFIRNLRVYMTDICDLAQPRLQ